MYYKAQVMQAIGRNYVFSTIPGKFPSAESFRASIKIRYQDKAYQIMSVEKISREEYFEMLEQARRFAAVHSTKPVA